MRPRLRIYAPSRCPLNHVIANCGSGPKALFEISRLEQLLPRVRVVPPDASQAISLQLELNRQRVGRLLGPLLLAEADFV